VRSAGPTGNDDASPTTERFAGAWPPRLSLTVREQELVRRLRRPPEVQRFLNDLPYNHAPPPAPPTLRSFRGVVTHGTAHCMEAALTAATILEQHSYRPLVLSLESVDQLDHVIFVYRTPYGWGSVGRSRDPGLHGRRPCFRSIRSLVWSYVDPYVDLTGRITGYAVVDLRRLDSYDWRLSRRNVWKAERLLQEFPHRPLVTSDGRIDRLRKRFRAFKASYPNSKPLYYRGQERWGEIPRKF